MSLLFVVLVRRSSVGGSWFLLHSPVIAPKDSQQVSVEFGLHAILRSKAVASA